MARISIYEQWERDGELDNKLLLIEAMARDGLTQNDIAHNLGINIDTLIENKKRYPLFADAIKKGKEVADTNVENALYKRAIGYDYKEETKMEVDGELRTVKVVIKHMPPDTTAQIYWLKNRLPNKWRDKQEDDDSAKVADALTKVTDAIAKVRESK